MMGHAKLPDLGFCQLAKLYRVAYLQLELTRPLGVVHRWDLVGLDA
jgi:hypothetical protein